jgi:hypothetical protein
MAQVKPRLRCFDFYGRPRLHVGARLLREFESAWLRSDQPFPSRQAAAVLLNVLAFDFQAACYLGHGGVSADEFLGRSLAVWASLVGSPEQECARLFPNLESSERRELVELMCAKLTGAAESWERKGPDCPTCEDVVQQMLDELVAGRFVRMKYD